MRRRWIIGATVVALGAAVALAVARLGPAPLLVNRTGMSPIVLARDGSLLRLGLSTDERYRTWTPLAEIPPTVISPPTPRPHAVRS